MSLLSTLNMYLSLSEAAVNLFQPRVAFDMETSHLIYSAN